LSVLAGEGIERLAAQARATHQFDRGPLQAPAALGGFDQAALAVTRLCPLDRACGAVALLLGAVPGVKLDRIGARPEGARLVLPGRLVGLLRQPLGRWLEAAEAGFQLAPGQFAGDGTRLDHRPGRVGDDQTVTSLADFQAVVAQDLMHLGPASRALDLFQAFALDPAEQAFDARVPFHVVGPVLSPALLCLVVVAFQPVLAFQLLAELAQRLVVTLYGSWIV
jgi:hypothetical protein